MQIKEHLALSNIYLHHDDISAFVSCKCKSQLPFLCWRIFWAVYHTSWLGANLIVTSLDDEASVGKWFIYLSNWMYLILTIECVMEVILVVHMVYRRCDSTQNTGSRLPWYVKLTWLLYTLSVTGAIMVCLWYWTSVHKGREITAIRFNTHAVAALYILLNMIITRFPLRLLHFLYPVAFGVTYTLFTAVYYSLGGTSQYNKHYIYSILDWSKPGRTFAVSSLSNFVFIPIVHIVMWLLSLCIQKMFDKFRNNRVVYDQGLSSVDGEETSIG